MLKITMQAEGKRKTLRVEGKLVPPWVQELENCWRQCEESHLPLVLDLRAVTFVGAEGKELLGRIHSTGAKLVTSGFTMNAMVEQLEARFGEKGK